MCSEKHYEDTWFFVAEEDFRLSEAHDIEHSKLTKRCGEHNVMTGNAFRHSRLDGLVSACSSLSPSEMLQREMSRLGTDDTPADIEFLLRTGKTFKKRVEHLDSAVVDLVKLGIIASRRGVGDFVWYSWCSGRRAQHPGHGSTLVGLSVNAARRLRSLMTTMPVEHFDLELLRALCSPDNAGLKASYVWPSIGHFATHLSGCEGTNFLRKNEWKNKNIQQGTRGPDMYLGKFCEKNLIWVDNKRINYSEADRPWGVLWDNGQKQMWNAHEEDSKKSERAKRQWRVFRQQLQYRNWVETEAEAIVDFAHCLAEINTLPE